MTKYEIKREIRAKEREKSKLADDAQKIHEATPDNIEKIKEINKKLDELNNQISELEDELDKILEEEEFGNVRSGIPANAELVNANVINPSTGMVLGSFKMDNGLSTARTMNNVDTLALRSNETLVSRLPKNEQKSLDLGKLVRGAVTGNWNNALEERDAISTSSAGVLIPQVLSAEIIDKARAISLFMTAGVPVIPMGTNNMTIARVKKDPEFAFKEELAEASESNFELEPVTLKAKTAYGYAYVSLEAIESANNLNDVLYRVFAQALADTCDRGMLYGQNGDTFAPSGIMNDPDIHTLEAQNLFYDDFIRAMGKVKRSNGIPTVMGINAGTEEQLALVKDSNGNTLIMPPSLASLQQVVSNQLNEDAEEGSDALVFDSRAMLIGIQNQLRFKIIDNSDYCIKNGAIGFQIYSMLDCVAVQPKHICKITGLKDLHVPEP